MPETPKADRRSKSPRYLQITGGRSTDSRQPEDTDLRVGGTSRFRATDIDSWIADQSEEGGGHRLISAYHAKYYAHELTRRHAADGVDRLSQSLFDASVDLNPHQIEAALFALRNPLQEGVLLATRGTGQTIEAALVVCQYWAAPSSAAGHLSGQPAQAMGAGAARQIRRAHHRGGCRFSAQTVRRRHARHLQRQVGKAVVIMSYQFAAKLEAELRRALGCGGHRRSAQAAQRAPRQQPHRAGAQACTARPQRSCCSPPRRCRTR